MFRGPRAISSFSLLFFLLGLEDFQFSCRRDRVNSRVPSSLFSSSASRPLPPAHSCTYYPRCPVSPSSFYYSFTSSSPRPRHEHSRSHNISSSSPSTQAHSLSLPPDLSNYHRATLYERASSSSSSSLPARAQVCAYHLPGAASMPTRAYPPPELLKGRSFNVAKNSRQIGHIRRLYPSLHHVATPQEKNRRALEENPTRLILSSFLLLCSSRPQSLPPSPRISAFVEKGVQGRGKKIKKTT